MKTALEEFGIAAFVLPIINGEFYLAQRKTNPHEGLFGAVGGKSDALNLDEEKKSYFTEAASDLTEEPLYNSFCEPSCIDSITELLLHEPIKVTGLREFNEEIFSREEHSFNLDSNRLTNIQRIGYVVDEYKGKLIFCYFFTGDVTTNNFSPSERELSEFKPNSSVDNSEIFDITKLALQQAHSIYRNAIMFGFADDYSRFKKGGFMEAASKLSPDRQRINMETNMRGAGTGLPLMEELFYYAVIRNLTLNKIRMPIWAERRFSKIHQIRYGL